METYDFELEQSIIEFIVDRIEEIKILALEADEDKTDIYENLNLLTEFLYEHEDFPVAKQITH